jgi:acylphosphatase
MSQCLRIIITVKKIDDALFDFIQKSAQKNSIEGVVQAVGADKVRISVCGAKDSIENFIDALHKGAPKVPDMNDFEMEPFLKDKDYRGVFRVIR